VAIPSYDEYVATLSRLTEHVDPTAPTAETAAIKAAAQSLAALGQVDVITLDLTPSTHSVSRRQPAFSLRCQSPKTWVRYSLAKRRCGSTSFLTRRKSAKRG
jgi:hypothetical protein